MRVQTLGEFSEKMRSLMNLDVTNVESVFAFVETLIKRSDLALKLFIRTLEIALAGLIEFSVALYVKLFDQLVKLGTNIGFEIGKGIGRGLQAYVPGTDEYEKRLVIEPYRRLKQFQKDLAADRASALNDPRNFDVTKAKGGLIAAAPGADLESRVNNRLRSLLAAGMNAGISRDEMQGSALDTSSLVETTLENLSDLTGRFIGRFADDPRLEELAKEFGFAAKDVKFLRESAAKAAAGLGSLSLSSLLPSIRSSSATAASGSDFETQFFGFEEFQRFLQSGTTETVQVAENTKRIVEYSAEQVNYLNKLTIKTDTLIQLMGTNGVYSTPTGGLGWEN